MAKSTELYNDVMSDLREMSEQERKDFFTIMAVTCIAALRASEGDEFVQDFLTAAKADTSLGIVPKVHG